jgi:hypothetical protein
MNCAACQLYSSFLVAGDELLCLKEDSELRRHYAVIQRDRRQHVKAKHRGTSPLDQLQVQESGFKERATSRSLNQGER